MPSRTARPQSAGWLEKTRRRDFLNWDSNAVLSHLCQIFDLPTRGGQGSLWLSSNFILSAAARPNKGILPLRLNQFCSAGFRQSLLLVSVAADFFRHRSSHGTPLNFASDNTAAIAPGIMQALARANDGFALGYGNDALTRSVEKRIGEAFECDAAVFLVPTGTAANALSLAHVTPPWGGVLCHAQAHIMTDECGAPEFFGGGLKLIGLPGEDCKLSRETVGAAIARYSGHVPHQVNAASLSLTQATEAGTIYRVDEVASLCEIAHAHGLAVHMDGARFGNALARMNVTPAEATWKAGIDVLSFGATKGGAMAAEAVVFFDSKRAQFMAERRKRAGHLLSKHRFLAAQFEGYLNDGYWLILARHANAMADRLADGLRAADIPIVWPVEANIVFALLPHALDGKLKAAGAAYYVRPNTLAGDDVAIGPGRMLVRLVTSFATAEAEVDRFVALVRAG
jgi:threonine aldolase